MIPQNNPHGTPIGIYLIALCMMWWSDSGRSAELVPSEEIVRKTRWINQQLLEPQSFPTPFSFAYDRQASSALLATWPRNTAVRQLSPTRTQHTLTYRDPKGSLEVRCVAVDYADFPVVEWTVYFKNVGQENSAILENIQGLDVLFQRSDAGEFILYGNKGDWCVAESYAPYQLTLGSQESKLFAPVGGRPTNGPEGWPYYNLQMPGGGVILAIGWPGQWACSFIRDDKNGLRIIAGQELTRLYLKPGEEIRTPLMALLFWQGADVIRAQNLWRRWFIAHNILKLNGQPPAPLTQMQLAPALGGSEEEMWREVKKFDAAGIPIDLYWHDAGWYPCEGNWVKTGTWEVDAQRFPKGFKSISDWIHARGKKLIVWFEPERVGDPKSWLAKQHPEWLLGGALLNLGHPDARHWVIEHIDKMIKENGIDYYRQDFNMDPLKYWRDHDAPDRQGITENLHVQGYLAFWDELRRRHPGMLIDSCASGGRRNDLETLRRAVPLLRSDFQPAHTWQAQQAQTYGLSAWVPYYGSGVYTVEPYAARSFYMPAFGLGGNQDLAKAKALYEECRQIAPFMLGDYYPLTPYSLQLDQWIAWQFNRPEQGDGVLQAFRREKNEAASKTFRLRGLEMASRYHVMNFDEDAHSQRTGQELMETGLTVTIKEPPGAAIITYQRISHSHEPAARPDASSTMAETANTKELALLSGNTIRVRAYSVAGKFQEEYQAKSGHDWGTVAMNHTDTSVGPMVVKDVKNHVFTGKLISATLTNDNLVELVELDGHRITRTLKIMETGPWIHVTTRLNPTGSVKLRTFTDRYRFVHASDWSYSPSVGGFNPDAQYKAPLILAQSGQMAFGIVPDLTTLDRSILRRCNHTLDLDISAGHSLAVGFMPARLASHAVYALDTNRTWTADSVVENSYYLLVTATTEPTQAYRQAVRFHWEQFGRAEQAYAADQQVGTDPRYKKLALWDEWRDMVWHRESPEMWLTVPLPDGSTGGGVRTKRWGPGPSVYLSSWFNSLRTSFGMALYAKRAGNSELLQLARQTVQLALKAPGKEGAFKCIAVPGKDAPSTLWAAGDGSGGSTKDGFLGYDMCWTGYWLLKWRAAQLPGSEGILARCQQLARFMMVRQSPDGLLPTRFAQDGSVQEELSRTVKAETGPVVLFLLELYRQDRNPQYLESARKGLAFLEQQVIPQRQWYDYETFWSCSPRKPRLDERTQQWPANNLALTQTVAAYLLAYQITADARYLALGEALLDYLLLYQQCWTNPALEDLTSQAMLLGGFTTQNSDAEWSDARQSQCGNILLDYYRATGKVEYLGRGIAALRAQFPISPSENWAHVGIRMAVICESTPDD